MTYRVVQLTITTISHDLSLSYLTMAVIAENNKLIEFAFWIFYERGLTKVTDLGHDSP
jgi:hypothetical protein